jgi:hypothetical protein
MKQAIEIASLVTTPAWSNVASSNPGRMSTPTTSTCGWYSPLPPLVLQSICEQRNFLCKDGGATLYRQIGEGGYAYLDRKILEGFHTYFPMSGKGMSVLENHLSVYKQELKPFVSELDSSLSWTSSRSQCRT